MTINPQSRPGKIWEDSLRKRVGCKLESFPRVRPRISLLINDNYSVNFLFPSRLTGSRKELNRRTVTPCTQTIKYQLNVKPLVVKHVFYCVNTSYPMDNSLSGRRGPACQTSEKDVLCFHRPDRSSTVHSPGIFFVWREICASEFYSVFGIFENTLLIFRVCLFARVPLLHSINQLASSLLILNRSHQPLPSALARVALLHSINRPASFPPTGLRQDLLIGKSLVTLIRVPLLHSINPPTSQSLDVTDLLVRLVPTLNPSLNLLAGLTASNVLTDHWHPLSPTPALLLCTGTGRIVPLVTFLRQ